jgi:hypothetical protein
MHRLADHSRAAQQSICQFLKLALKLLGSSVLQLAFGRAVNLGCAADCHVSSIEMYECRAIPRVAMGADIAIALVIRDP